MVLGDGHVEDLVGLQEGVKTGQLFSTTPPMSTSRKSSDRAESPRPLGAGGGLNAGALKAAARLVATDVGDDDPLGARLPTLANQLGDHLGLVLAACSGVRSQAMLGLITTTSWRLTKRRMPPDPQAPLD